MRFGTCGGQRAAGQKRGQRRFAGPTKQPRKAPAAPGAQTSSRVLPFPANKVVGRGVLEHVVKLLWKGHPGELGRADRHAACGDGRSGNNQNSAVGAARRLAVERLAPFARPDRRGQLTSAGSRVASGGLVLVGKSWRTATATLCTAGGLFETIAKSEGDAGPLARSCAAPRQARSEGLALRRARAHARTATGRTHAHGARAPAGV